MSERHGDVIFYDLGKLEQALAQRDELAQDLAWERWQRSQQQEAANSITNEAMRQTAEYRAQNETLVKMLRRLLKVIDSGSWRDRTQLSIAVHPAIDDARELLGVVGEVSK